MDIAGESQKGIIVSDYPDLNLQSQSIWSFLHPYFLRYNDLPSFVCPRTNKSYSYKNLIDYSLRFAGELERYVAYNSSEVVGVIMPNNIDYPIVQLGAFALGASICMIGHDFQQDIAQDMLKDANPKVLVIDSCVLEKFKPIFTDLPKVKIFVRGSEAKYPEGEDFHSVISSSGEVLNLERAKQIDPETIGVVTCSSGTTGKPKAILLTQRCLVNNVICLTQEPFYPVKKCVERSQDTMLTVLPYSHIFSILYYTLAATSAGCRILDLQTDDLSQILDVVHKFKVRIMTFRGFMVDALTKIEGVGEKLKSAEVIINVGCPLNPASARQLKELIGKDIFFSNTFGTSEIGVSIMCPLNLIYDEHPGATGKLIFNVKARLVDITTGQLILEPNTLGELHLKNPGGMKGYLNNPEATKDAFDGEWFRTGDTCYFDEDYYFYVIERFKDLISFRGKKVLPSAIETIIKQHEAVLDVGVVGVPYSNTKEEVPRAFICTKYPISEEEIIELVKSNAPDEEMWLRGGVTFVDTLPRDHLGKMMRKFLRDMSWSGAIKF